MKVTIVICILACACSGSVASVRRAPAEADVMLAGWRQIPRIVESTTPAGCLELEHWTVTAEGNIKHGSARSEVVDALPFELPEELEGVLRSKRRTQHVLRMSDGFLVGLNEGEWGGGVWWFSQNGDRHHLILDDNSVGLVYDQSRVVAITGLLHGGWDDGHGAIHELSEQEGVWTATTTLLPGAPLAFTHKPGLGVIIVTLHAVLSYRAGELLTIHGSNFLDPNSVAQLSDRTILIGMSCAIVRLAPRGAGFEEQWLVPRSQIGNECACTEEHSAAQSTR